MRSAGNEATAPRVRAREPTPVVRPEDVNPWADMTADEPYLPTRDETEVQPPPAKVPRPKGRTYCST